MQTRFIKAYQDILKAEHGMTLTRAQIKSVLSGLADTTRDELELGQEVKLTGLVTLRVKDVPERIFSNPQGKDFPAIVKPAHRVVKAKPRVAGF